MTLLIYFVPIFLFSITFGEAEQFNCLECPESISFRPVMTRKTRCECISDSDAPVYDPLTKKCGSFLGCSVFTSWSFIVAPNKEVSQQEKADSDTSQDTQLSENYEDTDDSKINFKESVVDSVKILFKKQISNNSETNLNSTVTKFIKDFKILFTSFLRRWYNRNHKLFLRCHEDMECFAKEILQHNPKYIAKEMFSLWARLNVPKDLLKLFWKNCDEIRECSALKDFLFKVMKQATSMFLPLATESLMNIFVDHTEQPLNFVKDIPTNILQLLTRFSSED